MPLLIKTSTIGVRDLALLHPDRIGVIPHRRAEVVVAVDQVRPVDARRHLDDHRRCAVAGKDVHSQREYWWGNRRYRRAPPGSLVPLIELDDVHALGRGLLHLAHPVHDHAAAAAVGHRSDVLREVCLGDVLARR
ncbi:hypothetical protein ABH929_003399 [Curtobacterium sp. AB7]